MVCILYLLIVSCPLKKLFVSLRGPFNDSGEAIRRPRQMDILRCGPTILFHVEILFTERFLGDDLD